jgi:hypothetical protein
MRPIVYGMILLTSLTLMGCSRILPAKVVTVTKVSKDGNTDNSKTKASPAK